MLTEKTETLYVAARRGSILSDGYPTPEQATQQATHLNEGMTAVGMKPDVEVVTIEVSTLLGTPQPFTPETEATLPETADPENSPETEKDPSNKG